MVRELLPVPIGWKYIDDLLEVFESPQNSVVLKSRQMYASTLGMARYLHKLLFGNNFQAKVITQDAKLCYNKTDESLFGRIETMHKNLPRYLQSKEMVFSQHPDIKIVNRANGNALIGSATTATSARGGTYEETWLDESAFYGNMAEMLFTSVVAGSGKMLFNSTPNGKNFFYRIWREAELGKNKFIYRKVHWSEHPEYDQEWYDNKTAGLTESQRLREYEMSFEGSIEGRVWSFDVTKHVKTFDLNELTKFPLYLSFDFGWRDDTAVKFIYYDKRNDIAHIVGEYSINQTPLEKIVKNLIMYWHNVRGITTVEAERELNSAIGYGDPTGHQRHAEGSGDSAISQYGKFGISIYTQRKTNYTFGVNEVERRLTAVPEPKLLIDHRCFKTIDELLMCHWATDAYGAVKTTESEKYAHDDYSHGADAIRYFCENMPCSTSQDGLAIEVIDYIEEDDFCSVPYKK